MKKSSRFVSAALAALMVGSAFSAGVVTASAAKVKVKAPASVKASNVKKGIKLTWKKAKGVKKYKVYRGKKLLASVKKATYTDAKVKQGVKYTYTVKSVKGKTVKAAKKVSVWRIKAPTSVKAQNFKGGIEISWKNKNYLKHKIYRKAAGSKYVLIYTSAESEDLFVDTDVENGKKYTYKIKACIGKSVSAYSNAVSVEYMEIVKNVKADIKTDGNTTTTVLTWDKHATATSYEVYRADLTGKQTPLGTVKETTYTDTVTGVNPEVYVYVIVAVGGVKSSYNGFGVLHLPASCYFTDAEGNVNVNLTLSVNDTYVNGSYLFSTFSFVGSLESSLGAKIEVVEGADVVKVDEHGVITATAAGNAKLKVTLGKEAVKVINETLSQMANGSFKNKLETGVAYVNITVK